MQYATYVGKSWLHNTWATFAAAQAAAFELRMAGVRVFIRRI